MPLQLCLPNNYLEAYEVFFTGKNNIVSTVGGVGPTTTKTVGKRGPATHPDKSAKTTSGM